jgi:hypothetical protein
VTRSGRVSSDGTSWSWKLDRQEPRGRDADEPKTQPMRTYGILGDMVKTKAKRRGKGTAEANDGGLKASADGEEARLFSPSSILPLI